MRVLVSLWLGILIPLLAAGQQTERGMVPAPQRAQDLRKGAYYALVIGVDRYQHLPVLKTAANYASAVEEMLRKHYGFETRVLLDEQATCAAIVNTLSRYRRTFRENDSLLICYAGHGQYDKDADKAYWLPVDADKDSPANRISADDIATDVRVLPAHHILIVSDSCFSGSLTCDIGGGLRADDHDAFVQKMQSGKSRTLLSSGGNEPVADAGSNGHSVFANAVLSGLAKMNGNPFTADSLFHRYIIEPVAGSSARLPQYNVIRNSGHDSGDFVFVPEGGVVTVAPPVNPTPVAVDSPRAIETKATPIPAEPPSAIQTKVNPKDGLTYVWIQPGTFRMGCSRGDSGCDSNEKPAHQVTITKGFWIGQTDVTQEAYRRVTGNDPSGFKGDRLPVESVNWKDSQRYCHTVGMRLPTEAEWEYAARAESDGIRYGDIDQIAWHIGNSGFKTHDVMQKQPNAWGLYDMLGNVWQWTADGYWYEYSGKAETDPQGSASVQWRARRGGAIDTSAVGIRASRRVASEPEMVEKDTGFRCLGN